MTVTLIIVRYYTHIHIYTDAKIMLARAVECVPQSIEMWLALAKLETHENARRVLNQVSATYTSICILILTYTFIYSLTLTHLLIQIILYMPISCSQAREALPTEPLTWIAAAKLEEANNSGAGIVDRIIEKMLASLGQHEVVIGREQWLQEAQQCERSGALLTCAAIVRNTLSIGVEDEDRLATWMDGKRPTYYNYEYMSITTVYTYNISLCALCRC